MTSAGWSTFLFPCYAPLPAHAQVVVQSGSCAEKGHMTALEPLLLETPLQQRTGIGIFLPVAGPAMTMAGATPGACGRTR